MKIKEYPANLIAACKDQKIRKLAEIRITGKELENAVEYVLNVLAIKNLRNADILRRRFQENMTLRQIAELYGLSTERVRQVITEGIFGITHPETWEIICYSDYWGEAELETEDEGFDRYIEENGFGGEIWACFNEFPDHEYRDQVYMCKLLPTHVFAEYMKCESFNASFTTKN